MKKHSKCLVVATMLTLLCSCAWQERAPKPSASAETPESMETAHEHCYVQEVIDASCVVEGQIVHLCECGDSWIETIPPTGAHAWDSGAVTKEAKCATSGVKTFSCTVCAATKNEMIPPTGEHAWGDETVTNKPGCLTAGNAIYTCSVCGETKSVYLKAIGAHSWDSGVVTREAKCATSAVKTFSCTVCAATKNEMITMTGKHTWNEGTVLEAATCLKSGIRIRACSDCVATKTDTIKPTNKHLWNLAENTELGAVYCCDMCEKPQTMYLNLDPSAYTNVFVDELVRRDGKSTYCITCDHPDHWKIEQEYLLQPNTWYTVSAEIKTENVVSTEGNNGNYGAVLCAGEDYNNSKVITGDSDWTLVYVHAQSNDEGILKISMNLGYDNSDCTGTAWFHNLTIHEKEEYAETLASLEAHATHFWINDSAVTEPLCAGEKTKQFVCSLCHQTKNEPVTHTWDEGTLTQAAGCLSDGWRIHTCIECGERKTEKVEAVGTHDWVVTLAEKTQRISQCRACDKIKTEYIPAAGGSIYTNKKSTKTTVFVDENVRRNGEATYCIKSDTPIHLNIEWTYQLEPNTTYVVSADIRTENVVGHTDFLRGANICAGNNYNNSTAIFGDSDWRTVSVVATSDANGRMKVSMNLGYYSDLCTGTAWFHGLTFCKVEDYFEDNPTWNFLFVVLGDTSLPQLGLTYTLKNEEYTALCKSIEDFEKDMNGISEGMFFVDADVIRCDAEMSDYKNASYGYYITSSSAYRYLSQQNIDIQDYDHVVFLATMPDIPRNYFGLGGTMIDGGRGFTLIMYGSGAMDSTKYCYKITPTHWPAGVYVHEFLHTMDTYGDHFGSTGANPDGAGTYGYPEVDHWRTFYADIIHDRVLYKGEHIGVDSYIWQLPPRFLN